MMITQQEMLASFLSGAVLTWLVVLLATKNRLVDEIKEIIQNALFAPSETRLVFLSDPTLNKKDLVKCIARITIKSYELCDQTLYNKWETNGQAKIVLRAVKNDDLDALYEDITAAGMQVVKEPFPPEVIQGGKRRGKVTRTEDARQEPPIKTAVIAIGPDDQSRIDRYTRKFKLL